MMLQSFLLLLSMIVVRSLCEQFNVSIDDTRGDELTGNIMITYTGLWNLGQDCPGCSADVDASQVFDRTWHDTTFRPGLTDSIIRSASVAFNGTAVYVVCILTGSNNAHLVGNTDMVFSLDGQQVGNLEQPPNGNTTFLYNQIVFSRTGLSSGTHNIQIDVGHNNTVALILLDRIIYTVEVSDSDAGLSTTAASLMPLTITAVEPSPTSTSGTPSSLVLFPTLPTLSYILLVTLWLTFAIAA